MLFPSLLLCALLLQAQSTFAVPAVTTSTKLVPVTSCYCTSKSTSNGRTSTYLYTNSATCSSRKVTPTCRTTTSTSKVVITPTSSTKTTTTSSIKSSTTSKPSSSTTSSSTTTSKPTSSSSTTSSTSTSASATPSPNSGPRGLAYNDPALTLPFSLGPKTPPSKVSWSYNWYSYPYVNGQAQQNYNPALSFTPMLWSAASDLTSVWRDNVAKSIAQYGATAVLGFNEPDLCWEGSACMSVTAAVEGWRAWMQPLKSTSPGLRLGGPGVSNSANAGQGLDWLSQFLVACSNCSIDFVPVHWYGDAGNLAGFKAFVTQAAGKVGGRKLWITEFGTTSGTAEQTEGFLKGAMAWLDGEGKGLVERYAWFMARPGMLISADGKGMSELGRVYDSG